MRTHMGEANSGAGKSVMAGTGCRAAQHSRQTQGGGRLLVHLNAAQHTPKCALGRRASPALNCSPSLAIELRNTPKISIRLFLSLSFQLREAFPVFRALCSRPTLSAFYPQPSTPTHPQMHSKVTHHSPRLQIDSALPTGSRTGTSQDAPDCFEHAFCHLLLLKDLQVQ